MSLTPQMRQSIQLLGMSVADLGEYIESILEKNPFLKKISEKKPHKSAIKDQALPYETQDERHTVNPRLTMLSQLKMSGLDEKALEIAEYLIFEMDDNGYITMDPAEAAENLAVDINDVEECLEAIRRMDPPGIGARDIRESLQLQLKRKGKEDSLEYRIVTAFLNDVAKNDIDRIAKSLKEDADNVKRAINEIKKLNPRPASGLLSTKSERVVPELKATINKSEVRLEINRGTLPELRAYNPYESELDIIEDPEARKFLKENMSSAKNLLDCLKRREDTICKVANYILAFQAENLNGKKKELKSLTIKDVAAALNFHPSTISRAVSGKYIQVNDEVLPVSSLLSHAVRKDNGEVTSKTAVKKKIAEIIKNEDLSAPLSDDAVKEILKSEGIAIERRTVAKYRQAFKILPSYLRKKVNPPSTTYQGRASL